MVSSILFGPQENIFHKKYCKNILYCVLFGTTDVSYSRNVNFMKLCCSYYVLNCY